MMTDEPPGERKSTVPETVIGAPPTESISVPTW